MKLPNKENAEIPKEKIMGYLLSFTHRTGRNKADFFASFGFTADLWEVLATALLHHSVINEVMKKEDTAFGTRYAIEGPIETPDERNPTIRAVWFVEKLETIPRFVTAYPC